MKAWERALSAGVLVCVFSSQAAAASQSEGRISLVFNSGSSNWEVYNESKCSVSGLYVKAAVSLRSASKFQRKRSLEGEFEREDLRFWGADVNPGEALALPLEDARYGVVPAGYALQDLAFIEARLFQGVEYDDVTKKLPLPDLFPALSSEHWSVHNRPEPEYLESLSRRGFLISGSWDIEKDRAILNVEACKND